MAIHLPAHISEREGPHYWPDGRADLSHWEDCAWCSAGMAYDVATGGKIQPTLIDMELVRSRVMGPSDGTNAQQLMAGIRAAWGWVPRLVPYNATFASLWSAVPVGGALDLMGRLSMFPDGHRLRRFSPTYLGGHAVCVVKLDEVTGWWDDPLAPQAGYAGERATTAELATFYGGLRGGGADTIITPPAVAVAAQGVEMFPVIHQLDYPAPRQFTIPAGTTLIGYDPSTPNVRYGEQTWALASQGEVVAEAAFDWQGGRPSFPDSGAFDPLNPVRPFLLVRGDAAYAGAYKGRWILKGLVQLAPLPAPAPGGITQAQLEAAAAAAATTAHDTTRSSAVAAGRAHLTALEAI